MKVHLYFFSIEVWIFNRCLVSKNLTLSYGPYHTGSGRRSG